MALGDICEMRLQELLLFCLIEEQLREEVAKLGELSRGGWVSDEARVGGKALLGDEVEGVVELKREWEVSEVAVDGESFVGEGDVSPEVLRRLLSFHLQGR